MKAVFRCERGLVRPMNQDSVLFRNEPTGPVSAVFAVADGMGGHKAGEVASATMVSKTEELLREAKAVSDNLRDFWQAIVSGASAKVYELSQTEPSYHNMGTTFVMAAFTEGRLCVCNIGDSRIYGLNQNRELVQLSHDHSLVQELLDLGQLSPEEAKNFPRRNIITRAVGVDKNVQPDVFFYNPSDYSRLLLCSDGLHGLVENWEMECLLLAEADLDKAADRLLNLALSRGGSDNISIILVDMNGGQAC